MLIRVDGHRQRFQGGGLINRPAQEDFQFRNAAFSASFAIRLPMEPEVLSLWEVGRQICPYQNERHFLAKQNISSQSFIYLLRRYFIGQMVYSGDTVK